MGNDEGKLEIGISDEYSVASIQLPLDSTRGGWIRRRPNEANRLIERGMNGTYTGFTSD
jgi:hypothetical protein